MGLRYSPSESSLSKSLKAPSSSKKEREGPLLSFSALAPALLRMRDCIIKRPMACQAMHKRVQKKNCNIYLRRGQRSLQSVLGHALNWQRFEPLLARAAAAARPAALCRLVHALHAASLGPCSGGGSRQPDRRPRVVSWEKIPRGLGSVARRIGPRAAIELGGEDVSAAAQQPRAGPAHRGV